MWIKSKNAVLTHFRRRSGRYHRSSNWVGDRELLDKIFALAAVRGGETVLDLATGTGIVAGRFRGQVKEVIGLDISADMTRQASACVDRMIISPIESIPLESESVDVCVCRQGLQFVSLPEAVEEIARVLRPGGRAVFCHLAAYGDEDKTEAFKIQALRNPARVNFFKPGDLEAVAQSSGLTVAETARHLSVESVDRWIDHGALNSQERKAVKDAYLASSQDFQRIHKIEEKNGDIFDTMLFVIIRAEKPK